MKIALVHDDLIQWGGAEKVFAKISNIFPDAPIFTAILDFKNPEIIKNFKGKTIITSFLQKIPFYKNLYKPLLPFYPIAFEQFDFSNFDLVISHTTRFAKSIITKPETIHICYIHTPPRFLWGFSGESTNLILEPIFSLLRKFDLISASRVDFWIAGSKNCQKRVKEIYKVESKILYPFVDSEIYNPVNSFEGDYYLIVTRLNKYKRVDVALQAFAESKRKLVIVGTGPELESLRSNSSDNISFLGQVGDKLLESLIAGCKGLIITAQEDFGMTAIEAQSFGKGVICFSKGGVLETVKSGITGVFFEEQSKESLKEALVRFESSNIDSSNCILNAKKFSVKNFEEKLLKLTTQARQISYVNV